MAFDIKAALAAAQARKFELFDSGVNPQLGRVLRTIGFNRGWVRGEGSHLWDEKGDRYLDLLAGWGVFNLGRKHPTVTKALHDILDDPLPGWLAMDAPALGGLLAEELKKRTPNHLDFVYFCNSGAEGVEAALKLSRAATGKPRIIHLKRAFHGLTCGAVSVCGDSSFRSGFEPYLPGTVAIDLDDIEALERELSAGDVAAFLFEPIQGKGVYIPKPGFLKAAQELCRKHGALLICDEVQTGLGRTGRFFAYEWEDGLDPDLVVVSKALSGGFVPVGACIMRRPVYEAVWSSMDRAIVHACTFGMGNLAMAAGLAAVHVLDEEKLMERALLMGEKIRLAIEKLQPRFEFIKEVRQRGLMIGIEFGKPRTLGLRTAWNLIHKMDPNLFAQGVVIPLFDNHKVLTQVAGHDSDTVKLLPPLTIAEEDVAWFLEAFEAVMTSIHRFPGPIWEVLKKLGKHAAKAQFAAKDPKSGKIHAP